MSIDDIRRSRLRQQKPDSSRVRPMEWNQIGIGLPDQPGKACLPGRVTNRLGQRRSRHDNAYPKLSRARQQNDHLAIVPIQRDQPARVEGDATHAALFLPLLCGG